MKFEDYINKDDGTYRLNKKELKSINIDKDLKNYKKEKESTKNINKDKKEKISLIKKLYKIINTKEFWKNFAGFSLLWIIVNLLFLRLILTGISYLFNIEISNSALLLTMFMPLYIFIGIIVIKLFSMYIQYAKEHHYTLINHIICYFVFSTIIAILAKLSFILIPLVVLLILFYGFTYGCGDCVKNLTKEEKETIANTTKKFCNNFKSNKSNYKQEGTYYQEDLWKREQEYTEKLKREQEYTEKLKREQEEKRKREQEYTEKLKREQEEKRKREDIRILYVIPRQGCVLITFTDNSTTTQTLFTNEYLQSYSSNSFTIYNDVDKRIKVFELEIGRKCFNSHWYSM